MRSIDLIAQLWQYQHKPGDLFHDDAKNDKLINTDGIIC
jgi:hypothetical protein